MFHSKKNIFPFLMTGLAFTAFIVVYLFFTYFSVSPIYGKTLIFLIPAVCFGILCWLYSKKKLTRRTINVVTLCLTPMFLIISFILILWFGCEQSTHTVSKVSMYERVLKKTGYPDYSRTAYFPKQIPASAENVTFEYCPQFLQGAETYVLKFQDTQDYIDTVLHKYENTCIWSGSGSSEEASKYGVFEEYAGYTVYVLDSRPYQKDDWNHGYCYGLGINNDTREIMYFSKKW